MCAGRVDPAMILYAIEKGAAGILLIGCKDRECRYGPGPGQGIKMVEKMKGMMHVFGLEPERIAILHYAFHEVNRFHEDMHAFAEQISTLGRSPLRDQS